MDVLAAGVALAPVLGLLALLVARCRQLWRRPAKWTEGWPGRGGEPAGDREPRRPLVPAASGAAALPVPPSAAEDGEAPARGPRTVTAAEPHRRLRAS